MTEEFSSNYWFLLSTPAHHWVRCWARSRAWQAWRRAYFWARRAMSWRSTGVELHVLPILLEARGGWRPEGCLCHQDLRATTVFLICRHHTKQESRRPRRPVGAEPGARVRFMFHDIYIYILGVCPCVATGTYNIMITYI
jgi:hypothetical protein